MVQLRPNWFYSRPAPGTSKTYWMLPLIRQPTIECWKTWLHDRNFATRSALNHARALEMMTRVVRGLMSYETCKVAELREIAQSRGLHLPTSSNKAAVVKFLEDADEIITFDRLLDLPPGVRNVIYTYYFDWLKKLPPRTCAPPISLASRQLRNETLPFFYERCTFVFIIKDGSIDPVTLRQLRAADSKHIARILHFDMRFSPGRDQTSAYSATIDFSGRTQPLRMNYGQSSLAEITSELEAATAKIMQKPKVTRFGLSEMDALIRAFQRGLNRGAIL